jgi:hypothetical protein
LNGKLDIEVRDGRVVSVWFNCLLLPFEQHDVPAAREAELGASANPPARIVSLIDVTYDTGAP